MGRWLMLRMAKRGHVILPGIAEFLGCVNSFICLNQKLKRQKGHILSRSYG